MRTLHPPSFASTVGRGWLLYARNAAKHYLPTLLQRNEAGDREKATSLLDESLAISSELGMRPLMERVLSRREILKA